jgi:FkbM family methyltransferase
MRTFREYARKVLINLLAVVVGKKPRIHRIPFGILRGKYLYMSVDLSVRMWLGRGEVSLAKRLAEVIKPGDVVYDIGAHIGYTVLVIDLYLNGSGEIHAFEVLPSTEVFLRKTVEANGLKNVAIHNVGLGLEERAIRLGVVSAAMTDIHSIPKEGQEAELCRIVSLDQYVKDKRLPPPSVIKMDVETAEIDCIRGASGVITSYKPIMFIEFHSLDLLREGYGILKDWGYSLRTSGGMVVSDEQLRSLTRFHETVCCFPKGGV